jgi:tetratricopeptide (TPR) repeat protein
VTPKPAARPTALRLARVHLRMGSLPLARAELEALAGRAMLDEDALLDLAEARWRTGDLGGAGEAANALLARGRNDALALVIAAESVSAQGRPGEARRLAARALEAADGPLDPVFAGIPRSLIWPGEVAAGADALPEDPGEPIATREPAPPPRTVSGTAAGIDPEAPPPASTGAAEAYAGGRAALGAGDAVQAAVRLGVALRLEPGYAKDVLDAVSDQAASEPALALVAGDALRLLGRESEALAAFDQARGRPPAEPAADPADAAGDEGPA